jgi:hypothetical protein
MDATPATLPTADSSSVCRSELDLIVLSFAPGRLGRDGAADAARSVTSIRASAQTSLGWLFLRMNPRTGSGITSSGSKRSHSLSGVIRPDLDSIGLKTAGTGSDRDPQRLASREASAQDSEILIGHSMTAGSAPVPNPVAAEAVPVSELEAVKASQCRHPGRVNAAPCGCSRGQHVDPIAGWPIPGNRYSQIARRGGSFRCSAGAGCWFRSTAIEAITRAVGLLRRLVAARVREPASGSFAPLSFQRGSGQGRSSALRGFAVDMGKAQ